MDGNDLRDYAQSNLEKVLARVPGVGEVTNFGSQYAMRVWLNPDKLTDYHLTFEDVIQALRSLQRGNLRRPVRRDAGREGPASERLDRGAEPAEDAGGVRRHSHSHQPGRLHRPDPATWAGPNWAPNPTTSQAFYNGKPTAGMAIRQAPGANALETADAVKEKLEEMSRYFPHGNEGGLSLRHDALRSGGHRGSGEDPVSRRSCWSSW